MLDNKKLNMIISLIIAIALWAFVIGEINPQATRVYREVPIKLIQQEILDESGLAVYSVSDRLVSVTLTGTRSEINKIDEKDVSATVDLADAYLGNNELDVDVHVSGKAEIDSQTVEKVTVIVEEWVMKEVPVEVFYEGSFNGEEEPITIEQELETVSVSGASTTVDEVAAATAIVPTGTVSDEVKDFQCDLIAVNQNGQRVYNVELSTNSIVVTSELVKLKTVPLAVSIEGEDSEDIKRTVKAPEKITLKGKSSDLEDIDSIETETIYLDKILTSTTIPVIPIIPEGVSIAKDSENLTVAVQVTEIQTISFSFDDDNLEFRNLKDGLEAQTDIGNIKVEVTGSKSSIDSLTEEEITIFLDLAELEQGKQKVDLLAECAVEDTALTVSPKKVSVTLNKIAEEEKQQADDESTEQEDIEVITPGEQQADDESVEQENNSENSEE